MSVEFDHNIEIYINLGNNIEDSLLNKNYPLYINYISMKNPIFLKNFYWFNEISQKQHL